MSAIHPVTLPKWGLEMAEGTIAAWHLGEGETAETGADLVDIETAKIVNTLDLERGGTLRRRLAQAGDTLPVGALIAVLAPPSVSDAEVEAFVRGFKPIDASFEPSAEAETPAPLPAPAAPPPPTTRPVPPPASVVSDDDLKARSDATHATPIARRLAQQLRLDLSTVTGTGKGGRISQEDVQRAADARAGAPAAPAADERPAPAPLSDEALLARNEAVRSTPIARRFAKTLGVDMSVLTATGTRGRVSLEDVRNAAAASGIAPAVVEASERAAGPAARYLARSLKVEIQDVAPTGVKGRVSKEDVRLHAETREEPAPGLVPFTGMRRTIAQILLQAKRNVPHFYTTIDVTVDELIALRQRVNARPQADLKVSLNDFLLKASALALQAEPGVNVHVFENGVQPFHEAHIAMAVAIEGGLMTPVVRSVAGKGVVDIARETAGLSEQARSRSLTTESLTGATFTVSNLGMFGIRQFDAIINPPQGAILAVGGTRREARETANGIAFATVMTLTLSADHRAIDGALAARFLVALRGFLEDPLSLVM